MQSSGNLCSAIKFDIDLIVAINDYSYATGHAVVTTVHDILREHERVLKSRRIDVLSVELPESDEVIWILPKRTAEEAADIADMVRHDVKRSLEHVAYYQEACQFVAGKLTSPPLTEEERAGIGTVSAGVAAYDRGVESLLSDISSAIKEAKFRGRNRTVIYRREHASVIRDH